MKQYTVGVVLDTSTKLTLALANGRFPKERFPYFYKSPDIFDSTLLLLPLSFNCFKAHCQFLLTFEIFAQEHREEEFAAGKLPHERLIL